MPNLLAQALKLPEISLDRFVGELEGLSGYPSEDARLMSELVAKSCIKISDLGLDPKDTRASELYQALLVAYEQTAQTFGQAIGEQTGENLRTRYERIARILGSYSQGEVWALKRTAVKKLLLAHPPRRLMKHLKYRSADSMIKREDILELFLAGQRVESARWQKLVASAYAKLPPGDFETRKAEVSVLPVRFWIGLETKRPLVISQPEVGLVVVWPNRLAKEMTSLGVITLSMRGLADLYSWSVALDVHHLRADFGKAAGRVWGQSSPTALKLANRPIPWRSICSHYSAKPSERNETDDFAASWLNGDRLANIKFTHLFARLHVVLNWWADNDYLLFIDSRGKEVSLNLSDVAINHARAASYAKRSFGEAQASLYDELINRYLWYDGVANLVSDRIQVHDEKNRSINLEVAYKPLLSRQLEAR